MKLIIYILYTILVSSLAIGTFIEKTNGSTFVSEHIYNAGWFIVLWGALTGMACRYLLQQKIYHRKSIGLLHISFVVILCGACLTHFTSRQGMLHLRMETDGHASTFGTNHFVEPETQTKHLLPFALKLDTFYIHYYPGTEAPADYVSHVSTIETPSASSEISMNHIFVYQGYRFYQSSFDEDLRGSWLSVNYDPWGIPVTYTGYAILLIAILGVLFSPQGRFRKMLRSPLLKQMGVMALLICSSIQTIQGKVIDRQEADGYRSKQVVYNDRIVPLNTVARDFVIKMTGKDSYKGQTPEQMMLGCLLYPDEWQFEPIIKIENKELQQRLNCGKHARLVDFFDENKNYRLQKYWDQLHQSGKQNALTKAIAEADEKVALFSMLRSGTLFKAIPADSGITRLSDAKVKAELLYNSIPFTTLLYRFNLLMGVLLFLCQWGKGSFFQSRKLKTVAIGLLVTSLLFHTTGMGLRTFIAGRLPMSNGYETMQFMAWVVLVAAVWLYCRFSLMGCFGFLLSGFTLLVADISQMNPQITPLMPVLSSPLLSLHVSLIMMSYALLAIMMLNGMAALIYHWKKNKEQVERITLLSRIMLYPATLLLGAGIFIGAIWANISWGRYWGWDPKEVWALITFMIYGVAYHTQSIKALQRPIFFHLFLIFAFSCVLMTYFGVNYILGGMHSYANN